MFLAACATTTPDPRESIDAAATVRPAPIASTGPSSDTRPPADSDDLVGARLRFSSGADSIDVTIGIDSPAVRDLVNQLPLTVTLEDFAGREKIAFLPSRLDHAGSPGSDPVDGDLIYYVPWGNLGFYYDARGIGYSDQTLHIGTYTGTREHLDRFDGREVTITLVL